MSFAIPFKFATQQVARQSITKAVMPKRLGPNPILVELKRVIPTIGQWSVLMFSFLMWPQAFKYGMEKTTGV